MKTRAAAKILACVGMMWFLFSAGCRSHGEKLSFKEGEIFYKKPVHKETVKKVGKYLVDVGYFTNDSRKSVQLLKEDGTYHLKFVVKNPEKIDGEVKESFIFLGGLISHYALDGSPVEVHLCDRSLKTKQKMEVPREIGNFGIQLIFGKGEVFYKDPVDKDTAQKVGVFLKDSGYFDDKRRRSVMLETGEGDVLGIKFVVTEKPDQKLKLGFVRMGEMISKDVLGGSAVVVHLCDAKLNCHETL